LKIVDSEVTWSLKAANRVEMNQGGGCSVTQNTNKTTTKNTTKNKKKEKLTKSARCTEGFLEEIAWNRSNEKGGGVSGNIRNRKEDALSSSPSSM
jgi:hypothetical protein